MSLRNDFLWSSSRSKAFHRCKREFYLRVWGGWGGWEAKAAPDTRLNYQLSKMANLDLWAGDIVHQVIQGFITNRNADYDWQAEISNRMNEDWRRSKAEAWQQNPKYNLNLFEHFYRQPVSASRAEGIKLKVRQCLRTFIDSRIFRDIREGRFHVEEVEFLTDFKIGESPSFKICVKLDLLGVDAEGRTVVWDWKTGRENVDDEDQAELYALYAAQEKGRDPVTSARHYLLGNRIERKDYTAAELERRRQRVLLECTEIARRITDLEKNTTEIERWDPTGDYSKCARCPYHVVCHGTREIRSLEAVA